MMMIKAGAPVDSVLGELLPILDAGDVVIDGGNSWYRDTQRRERECAERGVRFCGMGVSGGQEGARRGPSLMPGGDREAYGRIRPLLEAIAAKTEAGACVGHVGPDGAGHFVKMVHNGIEYADMQLIAEIYDLLRRGAALAPPQIADVLARWNEGALESYLIEISAAILRVPDGEGGWLVDGVLDRAEQKGTGRWTAQVALELGVPVPSIAAAIDARVLSSMRSFRVAASARKEALPAKAALAPSDWLAPVRDALEAAKICAYAQGFALIDAASRESGWGVPLGEIARIWKGGCIIRARLLDDIRAAYAAGEYPANLLLDAALGRRVIGLLPALRRVVAAGAERGIPLPGLGASLAYHESLHSADLPQSLTQAQRDAFGAHTYRRKDDPEGPAVHSDWLGTERKTP
jgi:6-phosphogluconate dehydrogenase